MYSIKKEIKLEAFKGILTTGFFENIISNEKLIDFLNSIWELKLLPSTDSRFKDLEGDIIKHIVLNDDWDFNTLFLEKLSLLDDDNKFQQFIEQVANSPFNGQGQDAKELINIINDSLNKERFELAICNYSDDGSPIYAVTYLAGSSISTDFPINIIPFFVEKNPTGNTNKFSSHTKPNKYPAFVLVADNWDDFGVRSYFDLFYYSDSDNRTYIGAVKIIHITELSRLEVDEKGYKTKEYIPEEFEILSDNFCSLGQMQEYYDNIKSLFPQNYKSILWAIQDCAIFSEIEDNFSKHKQFYSLIRENRVEQLLRQEKYIIEGQNVKSRYQFSYQFTPKYSEETITIDFKFDKEGILPNRIYAIIGENGVGKTQFITTLPLDIAKKESNNFTPHIPIFSKIIAVSNSYYDNFTIPKRTASFNYVYCGISKLAKKEREVLTPSDLRQRLQKAFKEIQKQERVQSLKNILDNILDKDIIEKLFKIEINEDGEKLIFQYKNITSICDKISSGQSTLMYVFSDIVSNIRYDSLLLFDEPETHLHPNAITTLMTAIYELLEEYQSYSIISTHSPLIVRELLSRSVYIMERSGNYPSIKKIGLESFGENLTVLTEEIFSNKEVPKYYKRVINELILKGLTFEEITSQLKTEGIPLSLNVTMYIKSLIEMCNEKN